MAKRYGRNQRRRHRDEMRAAADQIASLTRKAGHQMARADAAERRERDAVAVAVRQIMQDHGDLRHILAEISHEMGRHLAEELQPAAEKIMKAMRTRDGRPAFRIDATNEPYDIVVIRGSIHADYNVAIKA